MFVYYVCECSLAYRVQKTDPDMGLLNLKMPCPGVSCPGEVQITEASEAAEHNPKPIGAKTLWEACMGRGFPEDRLCSPQALKKLLINAVIAELDLAPASADPDRSIVSTMRVETSRGPDFIIHFGGSTHGATIFKATEVQ